MRPRLRQVILVIAYLSVVLALAGDRIRDQRFSPLVRSVDTLGFALTPPNLVGPVWAAFRAGRRATLSGGEVLWAWSGAVWAWWTFLVFTDAFHHNNAGHMELLVCLTLLSATVATVVAVAGGRPPGRGIAWAHYVGWALLECDAIFWGIVASF